jgi:hypothetical protein
MEGSTKGNNKKLKQKSRFMKVPRDQLINKYLYS